MAKKFDLSSVTFAPHFGRGNGSGRGDDKHAFIRTYKGGKIILYFSANLIKNLEIDDWDYILLGYDKPTQSIILKKTTIDEESNCVRKFTKVNDENAQRRLNLEAFVRYFGIDIDKDIMYETTMYSKDILILSPVE